MQFTLGDDERPIDFNYLTDRLVHATFGTATHTPGNAETFEMYFSNGYTLRVIAEKAKAVRINLLPPPSKK